MNSILAATCNAPFQISSLFPSDSEGLTPSVFPCFAESAVFTVAPFSDAATTRTAEFNAH